jgi:hypothetical protein
MFVQAVTLLERQFAHTNVVGLAAREVVERCAPAGLLQHTQIDLQPVVQLDRTLAGAMTQNTRYALHLYECIHDRGGIVAGDQNVHIADGGSPAPNAASDCTFDRTGLFQEQIQYCLRSR